MQCFHDMASVIIVTRHCHCHDFVTLSLMWSSWRLITGACCPPACPQALVSLPSRGPRQLWNKTKYFRLHLYYEVSKRALTETWDPLRQTWDRPKTDLRQTWDRPETDLRETWAKYMKIMSFRQTFIWQTHRRTLPFLELLTEPKNKR